MNEAFRPKGGNGVHGLFDDAGAFGAVELHKCGGILKLLCNGKRIAIPQGYFRWASQCEHWLAMTCVRTAPELQTSTQNCPLTTAHCPLTFSQTLEIRLQPPSPQRVPLYPGIAAGPVCGL